jgi:small subunit ribosomal protein S27Ae
MAKKKAKNKRPSKRWEKYKLNSGKLVKSKSCPKCGEGVFMGDHKDRFFCGKCHYAEFKPK